MTTTGAIIILEGEGDKQIAAIKETPIPKVRDDWVLVETKAVALNPTDWKHVDWKYGNPGAKLGCDYAGVVVEVGGNVTSLKEGDRICGFAHGGNRRNHESGAYAKYIIAKAQNAIIIPDNIDFVEAATVPVGLFTCALGLYHSLKLPLPGQNKEAFPVLIHSGATSAGIWGIQLLKASGLTVITTSSPSNFEYLRSLGADHTFDYKSPTCAADIRELTGNKLIHAWDCAGGGEALCAGALSSELPSTYGSINAPNYPETLRSVNPLVKGPLVVIAYNVVGDEWEWMGQRVQPDPSEVAFAAEFKEIGRDLLEKGVIKGPNVALNLGGSGLEGVMKGLDELREGKVRGKKLVYTL